MRELVSNGFDAITKLNKISLSGEEIRDADALDFAIDITIDREQGTLSFSDNGIGMTTEEVEKYIAQIAFSGAEEFVKRYEESADKSKSGIIGNFGLGFYSSFMISSKVEIDSLSYRPDASAVLWSSDGSEEYEIGVGSRATRGTTIRLYLTDEEKSYLEPGEVENLVRKYCGFMAVPIRVDGKEINTQKPLWAKAPSEVSREEYIEFYKHLYPFQGDPLFYIHLNVDYPFRLQGILYFPRLSHEMDLNKSDVRIYCKQVFVTEKAEQLIPRFLTVLQGVIDLPDLPLNVSRSYIQNEPQIRKISSHIIKKVADRLLDERKKRPDEYEKIWRDISPFVKYGMLEDDRFYDQAQEALLFELVAKDEEGKSRFVTVDEYLLTNKEKTNGRIFYVSDRLAQAAPLRLLEKQQIDVVLLDQAIDNHFIRLMESKASGEWSFARADAEIAESVVDQEADNELLDGDAKSRKEKIRELFESALKGLEGGDQVTVRVEPLKSDDLPAMVLLPEQSRRFGEMAAMMGQGDFAFPKEHSLIVNSKSPLIQRLAAPSLVDSDGRASGREDLARHIYKLARLAQGGLSATELSSFVEESHQILEKSL